MSISVGAISVPSSSDAAARGAQRVKLPPGVSLSWSGQFEYLERARARLALVVPFVLLVIFVLLFLTFQRMDEALLIMLSLPFFAGGRFWFIYCPRPQLLRSGAVGFIALAGVAAEFGVVMLLYLKQAVERPWRGTPMEAIDEGAVQRVRPKAMTVAVIIAGLIPIMWSEGSGAEVMQRIARP
jgi:Cu(I)/Ag(I) efflux system membrane protein CusA/SilA